MSQEEQNQIKAVLYGQCIGDAIGLLTEFLTKEEAKTVCSTSLLYLHLQTNISLCTVLHVLSLFCIESQVQLLIISLTIATSGPFF